MVTTTKTMAPKNNLVAEIKKSFFKVISYLLSVRFGKANQRVSSLKLISSLKKRLFQLLIISFSKDNLVKRNNRSFRKQKIKQANYLN